MDGGARGRVDGRAESLPLRRAVPLQGHQRRGPAQPRQGQARREYALDRSRRVDRRSMQIPPPSSAYRAGPGGERASCRGAEFIAVRSARQFVPSRRGRPRRVGHVEPGLRPFSASGGAFFRRLLAVAP